MEKRELFLQKIELEYKLFRRKMLMKGKNYILDHAESKFVVAEDRQDIDEDEDGYPDYDVDYSYFNTDAIDDITEKNGFAEIDCQWGAGRDG